MGVLVHTWTLPSEAWESRLRLAQAGNLGDEAVHRAARLAGSEPGLDFNAVKLEQEAGSVSLLDYPGFFDLDFPALWMARKACSTTAAAGATASGACGKTALRRSTGTSNSISGGLDPIPL
jgi:hypothetical protein